MGSCQTFQKSVSKKLRRAFIVNLEVPHNDELDINTVNLKIICHVSHDSRLICIPVLPG